MVHLRITDDWKIKLNQISKHFHKCPLAHFLTSTCSFAELNADEKYHMGATIVLDHEGEILYLFPKKEATFLLLVLPMLSSFLFILSPSTQHTITDKALT